MYFVENNVTYSIDDIVYKNVIISKEDIDDIDINNEIIKYREVETINNYNKNDYVKLDLSIFDLSNIDNYLRLLAMLKINDYKLYEDVKNLLLISNNNDSNEIILESTNNDFYMSVMNRLVIFLYKYNINGYYLSKTYNRKLSIIESHINFINS